MVSFLSKAKASAAPKSEPETAPKKSFLSSAKSSTAASSKGSTFPKAGTSSSSKSSSGGTSSFLKKGASAKAAMAEAEAAADLAQAEQGRLWRFWMPEDTERQITFLDGELDDEGMLDVPMFYEHYIKINGDGNNFVCLRDEEGTMCPICEKGDKPYLVGVCTVIDHTPHKVKSGKNAGKIIQNTRKLFVMKRQSIKQLSKLAVKRGGLTGTTWDVSRVGDKSANIGSQFDFVAKRTVEEIMEAYGLSDADQVAPANYDEEIVYRTAEELIELGVGKAQAGPGYEKSSGKSLKNEL